MTWIERLPVAHRGLHGSHVPENSLAAIRRALEEGYAVEVDVRQTVDGTPVVFHDATLDRMTGASGQIAKRTWRDVRGLVLGETTQTIPRLVDVLDLVDGQVPLLVELKNFGAPGALEEHTLDTLSGYPGPVAVQSFNPRSLAWFSRHAPAIPRGQVAGSFRGIDIEAYKRFLLKRLLLNPVSRPAFIAYEHDQLPYWPVTLARRLGLPVLAWTVRTRAQLERVRPYTDNVIFEGFEPELQP